MPDTTENIAADLEALATDIEGLRLLPGNPRRGDVVAVRRSYERFGQRKPIVALRDGTVIAGNHQLLAAKELGWSRIAVVRVDDDDQTAKAYALADNRTADLGTYDDGALLEMIRAIQDEPELLSASGYTDNDIAQLVAGVVDTDIDSTIDDLDQEHDGGLLHIIDVTLGDPVTSVAPGDIFLIDGKHWLICADVYREHGLWREYLEKAPDAIFLPYPEPLITLSPASESLTFIMVQPSPYLAGHLIDAHIKARGDKAVMRA